MHHTSAYTVAVGTTANTDVPAVADGIMAISNSHFLPQRDLDLIFASVQSATMQRARFNSPTNRQVTLPFIRPVRIGALAGAEPRVSDYRDNPFRVKGLEELAVEATSDIAMGTEQCSVIVGLCEPGRLGSAPKGDIFTMRGTSTTAAVARTWTAITMTWADTLSYGDFVVVGLEVIATNGIAARLTFDQQFFRPGCVGGVALSDRSHEMFRKGGLGLWGTFRATRFPIVEVYNNATDAVHTVYMDIVRTNPPVP